MSGSKNVLRFAFALLAIVGAGVVGRASAKPPSRIMGGRLATRSEVSPVVSLSVTGSDYHDHNCGAAVVGRRHVLTAAHCVDKFNATGMNVRGCVHDIRDDDNSQNRAIAKIIIHPDYLSYIPDERNAQNDLAVLVLDDDLPFGNRVQTLMLPTHQPEPSYEYAIGGWGIEDRILMIRQFELKMFTMILSDEKKCNDFARIPKTICSYSSVGSVCPGDSGSPLTRDGYVYGITSSGNCKAGEPSYFVNVYDYLDWINANVKL